MATKFTILLIIYLFVSTTSGQLLQSSVTYPGLGTFHRTDFFNLLHRPVLFLPQSPSTIGPTFHLFTRSNRDTADLLTFNSTTSLEQSHFDPNLPTKMSIHGWAGGIDSGDGLQRALKDALLETEDVNVILVDWSRGAAQLQAQAAVNTRLVGAMVGYQIRLICQTFNITPASFHLLGHSMGAHVSGYAGKFLRAESSSSSLLLGRITGLDPGNLYFTGTVPAARLWPTDAAFIDVIHTDSVIGLSFGWGMRETCGHVDFFVNGGHHQPGCPVEALTFWLDRPGNWLPRLIFCSHMRSLHVYIEALNDSLPLPKAYECDSYVDFTSGKCLDCGSSGERCALLGPRAIEYAEHLDESFSPNTNGRKWFLVTDRHDPLMRKYQILIQTGDNSGLTLLLERIDLLWLQFSADNGTTETMQIEGKSVISNLFSRTGSIAGVLGLDPITVTSISLRFPLNLLDQELTALSLGLDSVNLIALTSSESTPTSAAIERRFCNGQVKKKQKVKMNRLSFERC